MAKGNGPHDADRSAVKARLIRELARTGVQARACAAAGIDRRTIWAWRQSDAAFDAECATALARAETRRLQGLAERSFRPLKLTPAKQQKFLDMLAGTANVPLAAKAIGVSRPSLYVRKLRDPAFAKAWDEAFALGYAMVEERVVEEAVHGKRPRTKSDRAPASERMELAVFHHGQKRAGLTRGLAIDEAERDRNEALAAKWVADLLADVERLESERQAGGQ